MEEKEGQGVPADVAYCFGFGFVEVFVDAGDLNGLRIDFEHVLALFLFEVFFFGVACSFGELLVVLY